MQSKIVINNNFQEQIKLYIIYYIISKISKLVQVMGIINTTLKPSQPKKHTRLIICNTLTLPTFLYRCKTWAIWEQYKSRITPEEKKFMRTAKYTWQDYKTNEDILV